MSTDFNSREYYTNIRKAITAGYFMQVGWALCFSDLRVCLGSAMLVCAVWSVVC